MITPTAFVQIQKGKFQIVWPASIATGQYEAKNRLVMRERPGKLHGVDRRHAAVGPAPVRGAGHGVALRARRPRAEPRLRHDAHAQCRPRRIRHARCLRRVLGVHGRRRVAVRRRHRRSPRSVRWPGSRFTAAWYGACFATAGAGSTGSRATRCCSSSACRSSCRTSPLSPSRRTRAAWPTGRGLPPRQRGDDRQPDRARSSSPARLASPSRHCSAKAVWASRCARVIEKREAATIVGIDVDRVQASASASASRPRH